MLVRTLEAMFVKRIPNVSKFGRINFKTYSSKWATLPDFGRKLSLNIFFCPFSTSAALFKKHPTRGLVIYFRNPFTWVKNAWYFFKLRTHWDSTFLVADFLHGCCQAFCIVCSKIATDEYQDLEGLVTSEGLKQLQKDISSIDVKLRQKLIIDMDDIYLVQPQKVVLHTPTGTDYKFCIVDVLFLSVQLFIEDDKLSERLVTEALFRFNREYTAGAPQEWVIGKIHFRRHGVF